MNYLTVKEVAELKGCSERYIKTLCSNNKIQAIQEMNSKGRPKYCIPVTALPDELQQRYYKRQRSDAGLLPEVKEKKKTAARKQRSFEELTADERAEVNVWTEILKEWQGLRNGYNGSKVEFDKLYIGKCQIEHPDIKVSKDILYRKWSAYRENDMEGLIDKRGAWNKGSSKIPAPVWDCFLWYWLDENQPTASLCYRNTIEWTEEFYPELVSMIPTERSFRRQIDRDVKWAKQSAP